MQSSFVSARKALMREVSVEISITLSFGQRNGQEMKASFPILVTLSGRVMVVRLKQYWKALSPMLVRLYVTPS